jgi:hypothetical protein
MNILRKIMKMHVGNQSFIKLNIIWLDGLIIRYPPFPCTQKLIVLKHSHILQINPTRCTVLFSIFISFLYMFRATMCPSSGEITVSMRHWYLSLCMGGSFTPTSRPDATHTEWQIPLSHRYSNFSWWQAHGCQKHVKKRNKYTKQNCAPSWIYLQDCTGMHGQQNIIFPHAASSDWIIQSGLLHFNK